MPRKRAPAITHETFLENGRDDRFREFIYAFLITSVRMEKVREKIGGLIGLNGIRYHILTVISELAAEAPVAVGDVARALHAGRTYVTMETGRLEKQGLIAKTPNPEDGRSVLVTLTAKGRRAMEDLAPYRREINDDLFAGLSGDDFRAFHGLMTKMVATTENALATADRLAGARRNLDDAA